MNKLPPATLILLSLFCFGVLHLQAQADSKAVMIRGKIYIDVDDTCKIYLNGKLIHHAQENFSITPEVALTVGDRLVVHVWDAGNAKGLKLVFVSTDKQWMFNFSDKSYRYWRDPEVMDFTAADFQGLKEGPKKFGGKTDRIPFKNNSDYVWGDKPTGSSWLAVMITKDMVVPFKK
jgi:hypothetical protein